MMMKINLVPRSRRRAIARRVLAVFSVTASLFGFMIGCGNNNPPTSSVVLPSGAAVVPGAPFYPGLGFTGSCPSGPTGDFNTNCALCFHGVPASLAGQPICQFKEQVAAMPYATPGAPPIPILSPSAPAGPQAWPVYSLATWGSATQPGNYPIALKQGFRLGFSGSGRWDFATTGSWSSLCRANDFTGARDGRKKGTHVVINPENGQPEALFASDGIEAFILGERMPSRVVNHDGVLRVGFNVPAMGITHGCAEFSELRFTVSGCVNTAWAAVPCP